MTAVNDLVTISEDMKLLLDKANELYELAKRENMDEIFPKVIGTQLKQAEQTDSYRTFLTNFPL